MPTNPYAPPVPSAEPFPAKRPFFKSGSGILLAAFVGHFLIAFGPYSLLLLGVAMTCEALRISNISGVLVYVSIINGIVAIFTTLVPLGVWMFGRVRRLENRLLWLWRGVITIAALQAILNWIRKIYWFMVITDHIEPTDQPLFVLTDVAKTLTLLGLAGLIRQLAKGRQLLWAERLATAALFFVLAGFAWSFVLENPIPIKPGADQWYPDTISNNSRRSGRRSNEMR